MEQSLPGKLNEGLIATSQHDRRRDRLTQQIFVYLLKPVMPAHT